MKSDIHFVEYDVKEVTGTTDASFVSVVEWGNGEGLTVNFQDFDGDVVESHQSVDITFDQLYVLRAVLKAFAKAVDGE
jgi:hypothetical protein